MKQLYLFSVVICALLLGTSTVYGQTVTDFRISVRANDAKFVGTSMGGALVTITDRRTGDILVQGTTHGETDGTPALTADKIDRHPQLTSEESASFEFSLELIEPVPVTVTATAPLVEGQSAVSASKDMLLLPGKDYTEGNGIIVEIPGLVVDVVNPILHRKVPFDTDQPLRVVANIVKLCGCHIAEGSPWPPENYDVQAHIYNGSFLLQSAPMVYGGEPGIFATQLKMPGPGTYRIDITAYDRLTKEAGMDSTTIVFTAPQTEDSQDQ